MTVTSTRIGCRTGFRWVGLSRDDLCSDRVSRRQDLALVGPGAIHLRKDDTQNAQSSSCRRGGRSYILDSVPARLAAAHDISWWCQDASELDRKTCIAELSKEADVEIPAAPPRQFAPLSWDEARRLEKQGVTFGPHTVTHPVLSSTSEEDAQSEISTSWKRVCEELAHPVPVFCYPHGRRRVRIPRDDNRSACRLVGCGSRLSGKIPLSPASSAAGDLLCSPVSFF